MKHIIFILNFTVIYFFFIQSLLAQGETVFEYLTLRPGIKSNAMGGAQTAIANNYLAFYYNPAGLAKANYVSTGYSEINFDHPLGENQYPAWGVAVATPVGVIGYFSYASTLNFDAEAFPSIHYKSYQISYAHKLKNNIYLGFSLKHLQEETGSSVFRKAYSGDLGLLIENILPNLTFTLPFLNGQEWSQRFAGWHREGISFGFSILNTGPSKVKLDNGEMETHPLPQMLNLGIGYRVITSNILNVDMAVDFNKILVRVRQHNNYDNFFKAWFTSWEEDGWDSFHSGLDLNFYHLVSLYFGYEYHFNIENDTKGGTSIGFALGPDYAHFEALYKVYPVWLPNDIRQRQWWFGVSVSY